MVECDLAKVEVAGSNPVSRSIFFGGIAKWSGSGLQNRYSPVQIRMPPPVELQGFTRISVTCKPFFNVVFQFVKIFNYPLHGGYLRPSLCGMSALSNISYFPVSFPAYRTSFR